MGRLTGMREDMVNVWTENWIFAFCGTENEHPLPWDTERKRRVNSEKRKECAKEEWEAGY